MMYSQLWGRAQRGFALIPLLLTLILPAAHAANPPASLVVGGKTIPFMVSPFLGSDGQVYAPAEAVRLMGANFVSSNGGLTVAVTGANGRQVTVPALLVAGHSCISLQKVGPTLGASLDWQPATRTLTVRARLEMVRQDGNALSIYTSYPIAYQVQTIDNPDRAYVDLFGLDLATAPAAVPVLDGGGEITQIRSGQINFNTVRIAVDLRHAVAFRVNSREQTSRIRVSLEPGGPHAGSEVASNPPGNNSPRNDLPPLPVNPSAIRPTAPSNPVVPPAPGGVHITSVSVRPLNDSVTQVAVTATGAAKFRTETLDDPSRLAFDLVGAAVDAGVNPSLPGDGGTIKAVRSGVMRSGVAQFGRVVVDLARRVGFSINSQPSADGTVTYLINLLTNKASGGDTPSLPPAPIGPTYRIPPPGNGLNGLTVVVDPGHGAQDSGALGADGTCEKNLALAIGRKLRDTLRQYGANVLMTREDDTFLPVMGRPRYANSHGADYFISVHCDDSGGRHNSHTGTTVYFHAQNAVCRRMALDIVQRIGEVSGIPANGVKSDTIRFPASGFGVLRGSQMPAVLVECGYMDNDADLAKLKSDSTQQHIADGIVAGLRDFISDRAAHR